MPRKHNDDEMEEIGKKVEEWISLKDYQFALNFWNSISKDKLSEDELSDSSILEAEKEIGISYEKLSEWYWWDCFKNISGSGDI